MQGVEGEKMNREEILKVAKPIIFSTDSVQGILDNRKSQTRRVIKGLGNKWHVDRLLGDWHLSEPPYIKDGKLYWELQTDVDDSHVFKMNLPHKVGDILWVRETWCPAKRDFFYKADWERNDMGDMWQWKSPMYMPKAAARIFLQVTDMRVERLWNMNVNDFLREGIKPICGISTAPELVGAYADKYKEIWDKLNAKRGYPYDSNPWIWVISFERVMIDDCKKCEEKS